LPQRPSVWASVRCIPPGGRRFRRESAQADGVNEVVPPEALLSSAAANGSRARCLAQNLGFHSCIRPSGHFAKANLVAFCAFPVSLETASRQTLEKTSADYPRPMNVPSTFVEVRLPGQAEPKSRLREPPERERLSQSCCAAMFGSQPPARSFFLRREPDRACQQLSSASTPHEWWNSRGLVAGLGNGQFYGLGIVATCD